MGKKEEVEVTHARTGCTLLDLVIGGGVGFGIPFGTMINFVGDKSSGKTFVANEIIAATKYAGVDFVWNYDDCESGHTFDTKNLYGLEIMHKDTVKSEKIEDFGSNHFNFLNKLKAKKGIYVVDSLDGLNDKETEMRMEKRAKAHAKGEEFNEGSYDLASQRYLSREFFRGQMGKIKQHNSILVIISQIRYNLEPGVFKKKWTRSGGKGMDFYAHSCIWLSTVRKIERVGRTIGVVVRAKSEKSKTPRPFRECDFSLYFDHGIDNVGSNLDFLFDIRGSEGKLKKAAETIEWEKGEVFNRGELVAKIQQEKLEKVLEDKVIAKWEDIESKAISGLGKKYG